MDKHRKEFQIASEDERQLIDMAFNKKKADDRKEWLRQYVVKYEGKWGFRMNFRVY